jgi:hypothetical protein
MRLYRAILPVLAVIVFTLAFTAPANAAGSCEKVYATMSTIFVEEGLELGEIDGTLEGGAFLRYDDTALPLDPQSDPPNLVITSKDTVLNLWVYSATVMDKDSWWRNFKILRAEGTGRYSGHVIDLEIYGKCSLQGGDYEIEGRICKMSGLPETK